MSVLTELQAWYESQCNDDWEHQYGVKIETLDNPGWSVEIDLFQTNLEAKPFEEIASLEPEHDWIKCWVADYKFHGVGGALQLGHIIRIFLEWADSNSKKSGEHGLL